MSRWWATVTHVFMLLLLGQTIRAPFYDFGWDALLMYLITGAGVIGGLVKLHQACRLDDDARNVRLYLDLRRDRR